MAKRSKRVAKRATRRRSALKTTVGVLAAIAAIQTATSTALYAHKRYNERVDRDIADRVWRRFQLRYEPQTRRRM